MKLNTPFPIKTDDITLDYIKNHSELGEAMQQKSFTMGDIHTVKTQMEHKGIVYDMYISKPKTCTLTVYLKEFLFYASLQKKWYLTQFYANKGRPSQYERAKICFMRVVITPHTAIVHEPVFKEGVYVE